MAKFSQKNSNQQELSKIVEALKAYKPEKIILFGSMLDSSKPSNDIDLFLIKKTNFDRLGERAGEARRYLPDQRVPVDFLVYSPEEIEKEIGRGNVFLAEILEKGKLLYDAKI